MNWYYITFRSVTLAQRGEGILRRKGIDCHLQRTPRWMEQRGCGYCLRIRNTAVERSIALLRENSIPYSKIYRGQGGELAEEVHDDLFG